VRIPGSEQLALADAGQVIGFQAYVRDSTNVVSQRQLDSGVCGASTNTLACTYWWYTRSGVVETDIAYDTDSCLSIGAQPSCYDAQEVVTHEFGHFIGVAHVAARYLTMNPFSFFNEVIERTLGLGDVQGMRTLYP